ncbi:MAG: DNA mismatch repair endonuclease MutL [Bacteroidia bacterium]|nr:DNA mismatch repair endonuclease MutL [Bacteroidia bacterium]
MGRLQILPGNIADMIAAGEVVQRPASVVKELMENAVDAGADSVTVVIADAGRTLIQVIDNGCGMSPDDALLCFERHATSKISSAEDLSAIGTYGFRGEALASIAAVAQVSLKTRRQEDEVGTEVIIQASAVQSRTECAAPKGCNFAVRNLFYNVPARRKFLKSDNIEFKHIVEEFTRIALTRPELGFSLSHNGRDIYVLKPAKSLKFRITDLLGGSLASEVVDLHARSSAVGLDGFIGRPDSARKTAGSQFFFVNGRYFRSAYLHRAVMKAYEEFMAPGLTPTYFLFLEVPSGSVDVNIHPTKTEVKFEEDSIIFQVIYASVRKTLGQNAFGASIDFDTEGSVELPQLSGDFDGFRSSPAPSIGTDPDFNPFDLGRSEEAFSEDAGAHPGGRSAANPSAPSSFDSFPASGFSGAVDKSRDYGALFEDKFLPTTQLIILQGKYIVAPGSSGLMVVSIRRARERILFERFLDSLDSETHVTQASLFPVQVRVGVENRLLFDEYSSLLSSLGFDISAFGTDTIVVSGVPEGYSCDAAAVEKMVSDLILLLSEGPDSVSVAMKNSLAEKFALLGAMSEAPLKSPFEAQHLLDALFACGNPEYTPNGRRVISLLPVNELDKKF